MVCFQSVYDIRLSLRTVCTLRMWQWLKYRQTPETGLKLWMLLFSVDERKFVQLVYRTELSQSYIFCHILFVWLHFVRSFTKFSFLLSIIRNCQQHLRLQVSFLHYVLVQVYMCLSCRNRCDCFILWFVKKYHVPWSWFVRFFCHNLLLLVIEICLVIAIFRQLTFLFYFFMWA